MGRRRKKRKINPRKLLRRLERKADRSFSLYVRAASKLEYGKCPLCCIKPIQVNFHFVTRKRKMVRWDIRNVIGACSTCNFIENFWSDLSRAWYIRRFGVAQYLDVVDLSRQNFQPSVEYLEGIVKTYKDKLATLEATCQKIDSANS